jgi:hypothetical protein
VGTGTVKNSYGSTTLLGTVVAACSTLTNELLLEGHRAEAVVKVEEARLGIDPEEGGHVLVVGQRRGQTDQTHLLLGRLNVPSSKKMLHIEAIFKQTWRPKS